MFLQAPAHLPRAEVLSIIIEEVPCDCLTTTTASTTSLSACPSSSSSSFSSSSLPISTTSHSASNSSAIPQSSIAALPSLPSTESGVRTLTQTVTHPSTTLTTTLIFTPNPEEQSPNSNNGIPHPTPLSETVLSTPEVIAIIVLVSVVGTALFYTIYRIYVAQRINPAPASWRRGWVIGERKWGAAMREEMEEVRERETRARLEELRLAAARRREREEGLRPEREERERMERVERVRREQEHRRRQGRPIIVRVEGQEEDLRRGRRVRPRQDRRESPRRGSREGLASE